MDVEMILSLVPFAVILCAGIFVQAAAGFAAGLVIVPALLWFGYSIPAAQCSLLVATIDLYADGALATRYRCDGLIVATPIGSTAHNLSAGGPILRRQLQAIVISPISPHTLTYRPLVDSADTVLELTVTEPNESTSFVVDGRILSRLLPGDRVRIERAEQTFQMLAVSGHDDYRALRDKLGWGGSVPMKRSPQ